MSLTDYIYAHLSIWTEQIIMRTEGLVDSEASVNFIFMTFIDALRIKSLNLVSLKVVRADDAEISFSENEFFYSLMIVINEKTLSLHLFCTIDSSHWIILRLPWLQAVNSIINWWTKEVMIENEVKVASAAHFLEKAEDSLIYMYYTDLDKSGLMSELPAVY